MRSRYPVLLTYFIDNFGLAIIYPIFTPLVITAHFKFFTTPIPLEQRTIYLSFLIAAFPFAQLFGAPIIGSVSDRIGRKTAFIATITGTTVGYLISACGVLYSDIFILFIGRLWAGFFAGNLTICLASLSDQSKDVTEKTKNFSLLATTGGLSFILAIFISGSLSRLSTSAPFVLTAFLSIINLVLMLLLFQESHPSPFKEKVRLFHGIHHVMWIIKNKSLRNVYFVYFFFMIAWVTSMLFLPGVLLRTFAVSPNILTICFASIGLLWSLSNFLVNRLLAKTLSTYRILFFSLLLLSAALFAFILPVNLPWFLFLMGVAVFGAALSWTNTLVAVSMSASSDVQGKTLGINQSIGAVAAVIGPSIGGFLASTDLQHVFLFTASCSLLAAAIFKSGWSKTTPLV